MIKKEIKNIIKESHAIKEDNSKSDLSTVKKEPHTVKKEPHIIRKNLIHLKKSLILKVN